MAKKDLLKIENIDMKAKKVEEKIIKNEKYFTMRFKRAWVTFETITQRDMAYDYYFSTSFDRCLAKICCQLCCGDDNKKK